MESNDSNRPKLVCIDDDPIILGLIETGLQARFDIHSFQDPLEAISKIEGLHPDVILLDYKMPTINGDMVFETLKKNESTAFIPVIFVTAYEEELFQKIKCVDNLVGVVIKPFTLPELIKSVDEGLKIKSIQTSFERLFQKQ